MSRKRKHTDVAGGDRESNKPNFKPGNLSRTGHPKLPSKDSSTSSLRSRIRDLKRLLEHVENAPKHKMPAGARVERERELETLEHELAQKVAAEEEAEFRNKIIRKYHFVRFMERQKAERTVKRLHKQLSVSEDPSERSAVVRQIHNAEVDLSYALYYPLLRPYVSMYPRKNDTPTEADRKKAETIDGPKGDAAMWKTVESAMEEGTLDALRESKVGAAVPGSIEREWKSTKEKKEQKKTKQERKKPKLDDAKATEPKDGDEDSDGGFFE